MALYLLKAVIRTEFNKIIKKLGFGNGRSMSPAEIIADEKKHKAGKERMRARHAKSMNKNEKERQEVRDKYNLKKKDEPAAVTAGRKDAYEAVPSPPTSPIAKNHGFDAAKVTTNAPNSPKAKFGWK